MAGPGVERPRRAMMAFGINRRPGSQERTVGVAESSSFRNQLEQRFGHLESRVESMLSSQRASSTDSKMRFAKIEHVVESLRGKQYL